MTGFEDIVLTGTGLATGLGLSREQTWAALQQRRSAMKPLSAMESPLPPGKEGGQAVELPADFLPSEAREVRYLRWTLDAALTDAGLTPGGALPYASDRCSILLGTTLHGMRAAGQFLRSGDYRELIRFLAGSTLAAAAQPLGFTGMAATTCSACSSSLGSVALAVTLLQTGQADLVVAGGYDTISEYVYGGFNSLRLIADGPLRPFARDRRGMKLAEGYGLVVLERAGDAAARGATPIATVLGWGESADAHHLTQPHPHGDGAARAVEAALARAGRAPEQIDLIAAHATGTPDNDAGEHAALSRVFGTHLSATPVVAFKSQLGHTLGAAGAVELILSATAMRDAVLPPTANTTADELEFPGLRLTVDAPRPHVMRTTLTTSLGFGGANTAVVLGSPTRSTPTVRTPRPAEPVFITGVGVILPGLVGAAALAASDRALSRGGPVPETSLDGLLNARRVRRMSDYVKLTLAATTLACRDAGILDVPAFAATCAAVLGTTHGSSKYSETYYRTIVTDGIAAANPMLFAEAVPNGAAAQLSLMLSLKGACQTVIGTRTAGLDALTLAAARLGGGDWDRAIVGGGEEFSAMIEEAYRRCDGPVAALTSPLSAGAVMFILETRRSMEARPGARPRARLQATASFSGGHLLDALARALRGLNSPTCAAPAAPAGTRAGRAERAALRRAGIEPAPASAAAATHADTFSVAPLLAIAEALVRPAAADVAVVAADPVGLAAGVRLQLL